MKFSVDRAVLLKALTHVQSVVERRNTIPILANVMIEAGSGGTLKLTATDMEIAVVEDIAGVTVARAGRTTAPAATLYEIIRNLPEGARVEFDHGGGDGPLALRSGRFNTSLAVLAVDDFPSMTEGRMPVQFSIKAGVLRDLIDRTRFAISTEETRYYLNGIYIHATESEGQPVLRAVATDGHRLARVEEPLPEGAKAMPGVIIPRKTVNEIRKLAEETQDEIVVRLSDTKVQFALGTVTLTSKLIDGTFPEYERVIPRGNDKKLVVPRKDFADAVKRECGEGADVIVDGLGDAARDENFAALAPCGHWISLGQASGPLQPLSPDLLVQKSATFSRPVAFAYAGTRAALAERAQRVWDALADGTLKIAPIERHTLEAAARAHERLESRRTAGALVLLP